MALIGVGHLVGMSVGIAMLVGMLIAWGVCVPVLTSMQRRRPATSRRRSNDVFRNQVRFIGAGTIGVAAIWTLLKIIGPIVARHPLGHGRLAARAGGEVLTLTERDLPIGIVGGTIAGCRWSRSPRCCGGSPRAAPIAARRAARDRRHAASTCWSSARSSPRSAATWRG